MYEAVIASRGMPSVVSASVSTRRQTDNFDDRRRQSNRAIARADSQLDVDRDRNDSVGMYLDCAIKIQA